MKRIRERKEKIRTARLVQDTISIGTVVVDTVEAVPHAAPPVGKLILLVSVAAQRPCAHAVVGVVQPQSFLYVRLVYHVRPAYRVRDGLVVHPYSRQPRICCRAGEIDITFQSNVISFENYGPLFISTSIF